MLCFRKVTSHSKRNSIILASSLGRMLWTALSADSISGTCAVVGTPTVRLAYSSAKNSRHILETHWLGFSMSMVIFARGHGSGSVDRQCNNSDVSSGAITGSSPSFGRYWTVAAALPLLRCVWSLAASCADWIRGPCWLTMALRYLHARMAALRVLGPSSAWFLAAVARMSCASFSGDLDGSVLAVLGAEASTSHTGASLVLGRLAGMTKVGCTRHPSKK